MIAAFFDGLEELYHCAKFGEDRSTRAGCSRFENMAFVCFYRQVAMAIKFTQCVSGQKSAFSPL